MLGSDHSVRPYIIQTKTFALSTWGLVEVMIGIANQLRYSCLDDREDAMHDMQFVNSVPLKIDAQDTAAVKNQVAKYFPGVPPVPRHRFVMAPDLADLVASDRKMTTIRYDTAGVEYPAGPVLPMFVIDRENEENSAVFKGELRIRELKYKCVNQLDEEDARADGFSSREELLSRLRRFYGPLTDDKLVCIYSFEFVAPSMECDQTSKPRSNTRLRAG